MITPEPPAGSEHYREGWRHGYEQAAIDRERSADAVRLVPDTAISTRPEHLVRAEYADDELEEHFIAPDTGQAREPALIYDDEGNFHGVQGGACEHRTVGSHRAWCHDCREWCYPTGPCVRCKFEPSADTGQAPGVAAAVLAAAVAWKARYDEMFDEPPARGTTMRPIYDALLGTDADAPLTERPLAGDPDLPLSALFDNRDPHQDEMRAGTDTAEPGPVYVKPDEELPYA